MRAADLLYVMGNALHGGLVNSGVSRFHADQWYSRWCAEVQDLEQDGDADGKELCTRIVQCLADARNTAQVWGRG